MQLKMIAEESSDGCIRYKSFTRKPNRKPVKAQRNVPPLSFLDVFYAMINALDKPIWTSR